jgi:hypothetical protein
MKIQQVDNVDKNFKPLWSDFLSFYSRFYEVTILESTYATDEGKMQVYF